MKDETQIEPSAIKNIDTDVKGLNQAAVKIKVINALLPFIIATINNDGNEIRNGQKIISAIQLAGII